MSFEVVPEWVHIQYSETAKFTEVFQQGIEDIAIVRRPILRRSLLMAGGLLSP